MSRKQFKRRAGSMTSLVIAGIFIPIVVCGVGFGVMSTNPADSIDAGAFGFNEATYKVTQDQANLHQDAEQSSKKAVTGRQILTTTSARSLSAGLSMVDELERQQKERLKIDNEQVVVRVENAKAKQGMASDMNGGDTQAASSEMLDAYNLLPVDWQVGRDAFIEEWTARIDAYLQGTQLEGLGADFAVAAWENGVDPRWSPAISNTESGNGENCFLSHNAWGWGDTPWLDWKTAIEEHVAGLAREYGYSLTYTAAQKYCPPNSIYWYNNTLSQMELI